MTPFEELIQLLDLETIEHNLFRGHHPPARKKPLFGGQIIALLLVKNLVRLNYLLQGFNSPVVCLLAYPLLEAW